MIESKYTKKKEIDLGNHYTKSRLINSLIESLEEEYSISLTDIKKHIQEKEKIERKANVISICIFDNDKLSSLEAVVKYLKENKKLRFSEIASLLNRNDRTIWYTYSQSRKKLQKKFRIIKSYNLPLSIFKDRKFGVLELVSSYLKEEYKLRYSEIAKLLRRDERTIWTAYHRYIKKSS